MDMAWKGIRSLLGTIYKVYGSFIITTF